MKRTIATIDGGEDVELTPAEIAEHEAKSFDGRKKGLMRWAKSEAKRRILAIAPEWKQRNMLAEYIELDGAPEAAGRIAELKQAWAEINALRDRSDELESAIESATTIGELDSLEW